MLLSILTPAIPRRVDQLMALSAKITSQVEACKFWTNNAVEHLMLLDNHSMTIGDKRQRLVDAARGDYIAFVDDDDDIAHDYVQCLVHVARHQRPDVITFDQTAVINGQEGTVEFRLACQRDAPWEAGKRVVRGPWHVCAWRRELVASCRFTHVNYGEDMAWVSQARAHARTETHIQRVLHVYRHDAATTAAPAPGV